MVLDKQHKKHQTKDGEKQETGEGEWKTEGTQKEESSSLGKKEKHYNSGFLCE